MKESRFLGALLPSSPDFAPIIEAVRGKYNLHEVDPDGEAIKEIYLGDEIVPLEEFRKDLENFVCETYGDNAGIYYFGLLISKLDKSRKQIVKKTSTHPRSLDRKLRNIVDAGIPLTLADREEPLPPLSINL